MTWYESPALWIWLGAGVVQAILTWARVQVMAKNHDNLAREVSDQQKEIDSLREWRAQAREQFKNLERRKHEMGPREEEES